MIRHVVLNTSGSCNWPSAPRRAMRRISAAVRMPRLTSHHATFHTFVSRGNVCKLVTPPAFPALRHNTRRALRTLPDRTQLSHAEKSPHAERGARTLDGVQRSENWHDMDASHKLCGKRSAGIVTTGRMAQILHLTISIGLSSPGRSRRRRPRWATPKGRGTKILATPLAENLAQTRRRGC